MRNSPNCRVASENKMKNYSGGTRFRATPDEFHRRYYSKLSWNFCLLRAEHDALSHGVDKKGSIVYSQLSARGIIDNSPGVHKTVLRAQRAAKSRKRIHGCAQAI